MILSKIRIYSLSDPSYLFLSGKRKMTEDSVPEVEVTRLVSRTSGLGSRCFDVGVESLLLEVLSVTVKVVFRR